MDLRNLPDLHDAAARCNERSRRIADELGIDLSALTPRPETIGSADEKNCEQMFGHVPLPVGLAGPLTLTLSTDEQVETYLPLATTEGALVASVNRGCKALSAAGCKSTNVHHGISRSLALRLPEKKGPEGVRTFIEELAAKSDEWTKIATSTSNHLRILSTHIDTQDSYVFLTINCDTDEAMGMNMVTIAAQAVGNWIMNQLPHHSPEFITVAGNVDSDKKPSRRTKEMGRGYSVTVETTLNEEVIRDVLKSDLTHMQSVADAKLTAGSAVAGALGSNMHAANMIAALYLATGQDAAHVVEGSLADTTVTTTNNGLQIRLHLPAVLVGVRGGGTSLPAQRQCLDLLLHQNSNLHPKAQLAEVIGAGVLAGEVSLLAAQASHTLASAHKKLAR